MSQKVRIKDVASLAGISTGTVDRVLHNRGYVSEEARQKVLEALDALGYERNLIASTLAYNRTHRIVALLPDPSRDMYWEQPYQGILQAAAAVQHYGFRVETQFFDLFSVDDFTQKAERVLSSPPDGLIFPPIFEQEGRRVLAACESAGIPTVIFNTELDDARTLSYIGQDSYQSGVLAARLLDFALQPGDALWLLNLDTGAVNARHLLEKERGFRDYLLKNNRTDIAIRRDDFEGFDHPAQLSALFERALEQAPRIAGILVTNSRAYHLVQALPPDRLRGIKVVGFDLIEPNIRLLQSGRIHFLINQNSMEQGYLSVLTLYKHLFLKELSPAVQYLPLDIVVAENVAYYQKKQPGLAVVL